MMKHKPQVGTKKVGMGSKSKLNKNGSIDKEAFLAALAADTDVKVGTGGSGSLPDHTVLTLVDQPLHLKQAAPRQVQLMLNYIKNLGGSATVGQLLMAADIATGTNHWSRPSGKEYRQDVAQIGAHYQARLAGNAPWEKKGLEGKIAFVTIS